MTRDDWQPLAPGVYTDAAGAMHIVIDEVLALNGYADTPENRRTLLAVIRDTFTEATIVEDPEVRGHDQ
jgi:hypothetical protein